MELTLFEFRGRNLVCFVMAYNFNGKYAPEAGKTRMRTAFFTRVQQTTLYSSMAPRLSGQTSIFGVVFFVSKSLLGIERQKKLYKFAILTRKPRSHA